MCEIIIFFALIISNIGLFIVMIKQEKLLKDNVLGINREWYEAVKNLSNSWYKHLMSTENNIHGAMLRIINLEERVNKLESEGIEQGSEK